MGNTLLKQELGWTEGIGSAGTSLKTTARTSRSSRSGQSGLDQGGFTGLLRSSILECLENILGKAAMGALVQHFQIDQRAENPEELHSALTSIFGNGGRVLEKIIVKDFYMKLGLRLVENASTFDLQETILEARVRLGLPSGTRP